MRAGLSLHSWPNRPTAGAPAPPVPASCGAPLALPAAPACLHRRLDSAGAAIRRGLGGAAGGPGRAASLAPVALMRSHVAIWDFWSSCNAPPGHQCKALHWRRRYLRAPPPCVECAHSCLALLHRRALTVGVPHLAVAHSDDGTRGRACLPSSRRAGRQADSCGQRSQGHHPIAAGTRARQASHAGGTHAAAPANHRGGSGDARAAKAPPAASARRATPAPAAAVWGAGESSASLLQHSPLSLPAASSPEEEARRRLPVLAVLHAAHAYHARVDRRLRWGWGEERSGAPRRKDERGRRRGGPLASPLSASQLPIRSNSPTN